MYCNLFCRWFYEKIAKLLFRAITVSPQTAQFCLWPSKGRWCCTMVAQPWFLRGKNATLRPTLKLVPGKACSVIDSYYQAYFRHSNCCFGFPSSFIITKFRFILTISIPTVSWQCKLILWDFSQIATLTIGKWSSIVGIFIILEWRNGIIFLALVNYYLLHAYLYHLNS